MEEMEGYVQEVLDLIEYANGPITPEWGAKRAEAGHPGPAGEDVELGREFANELNVEIVDEHYYEKAGWFIENNQRYDAYDRTTSKIYLGEYAAKGNNVILCIHVTYR